VFCPYCGSKNEDEAKFCFKCGSSLGEAAKIVQLASEGGDGNVGFDNETASELEPEIGNPPNPLQEDAPLANDANAPKETPPDGAGQRGADRTFEHNDRPRQAKPAIASDSPAAIGAEQARSAIAGVSSFFADRKRLLAISIAIIAIIVLVALWFNLSGAGTLGQTRETFKAAFDSEQIAIEGAASNDYVRKTPYNVTAFECKEIKKVNDYQVTARISATVENDNFKTDVEAIATYTDPAKAPANVLAFIARSDGYAFDVTGAKTTPKKGIDYDESHGLENCEAVLSDDARSCAVEETYNVAKWFVDAEYDAKYLYQFDGKRWSYAEKEVTDSYSYHDVEGTYLPKTNNEVSFTIRDFDPENGTFVIDYTCNEEDAYWKYNVTGTLNASLSAKRYELDSGGFDTRYEFEAAGTSSGGDGQASANGEFVVADSGEDEMHLSDLSVGYTNSYNGRPAIGRQSGNLFK